MVMLMFMLMFMLMLMFMVMCVPSLLTRAITSMSSVTPQRHTWMGTTVVVEQYPHGIKIRAGELPCLAGSGATMLQCVNYVN